LGPPDSFCNIGELYFYPQGSDEPVYGKVIGTQGSEKKNMKEVAFDRDPLSLFNSPKPNGGWIGMDFGEPVMIDHISYTPRGDGNDVTPFDSYELLYWSDNGWHSAGVRIAKDISLIYDNIPSGTIYQLRNLSRGKDERIFTYKNKRQIWW
jgi:hypothetical protein